MISEGASVLHLARFVNGNPFKPEDLREVSDGGLPVVRIRQLLDETADMDYADPPSDAVLIGDGDLIFAWSATLAARVWRRGPAILNQHLFRVDTAPGVDRRWFSYVLEAGVERLKPLMHGSAMTHITADILRLLTVAVPPPDRQAAVADYLDAETARIDALVGTRSAQEALVHERQLSMLSWLLVPNGVVFVPLRRVAVIQSGLIVDALRDVGDDPVTRPYLRVANVQPGRLELESVTEIAVPRTLSERCTLRAGDVLMTEGGDLDKLGRGTVWRDELPGALHQNHIFAVRPLSDRLDPDYLALLTQTTHARDYFESTGVRTTNLASTNSEKIMSLPVPRLALSEQRRLVDEARARLDQMADFEGCLRSQTDRLLERRQALITAAMTCQIEIPGVAA